MPIICNIKLGNAVQNSHQGKEIESISLPWYEHLLYIHIIHSRTHLLTYLLTYSGTNRLKLDKEIQSYDVVITNFDSVSADCKASNGATKKKKVKGTGNLFRINWHRVVIDEAHVIRNAKTFMAKAVLQLTSKYRWILTGTPMPNGVADLESLFLFLGLSLFVTPTAASASESNGCFHRCIVRELKSGNGEGIFTHSPTYLLTHSLTHCHKHSSGTPQTIDEIIGFEANKNCNRCLYS